MDIQQLILQLIYMLTNFGVNFQRLGLLLRSVNIWTGVGQRQLGYLADCRLLKSVFSPLLISKILHYTVCVVL